MAMAAARLRSSFPLLRFESLSAQSSTIQRSLCCASFTQSEVPLALFGGAGNYASALSADTRVKGNGVDEKQSIGSESLEDFDQEIFGGPSVHSSNDELIYQQLDKIRQLRDPSSTFNDGMDGKLKQVASYFEMDYEETAKDDYTFRPDMHFRETYDIQDIDLTKPAERKPVKRHEFETTTAEVLKKADFRNVRFLANFVTAAGIIIKRNMTGISAKAQRKIAREIKTARAFGLMPFTTMGTKSFVFGKTMEDRDQDYEYEIYNATSGGGNEELDP